jgi:Transmembrane secretion effector
LRSASRSPAEQLSPLRRARTGNPKPSSTPEEPTMPAGAALRGIRELLLETDRFRRFGDLNRVPLLSWLGLLSFPVILGIGFLVGGFFPAYQSSSQIIQAGLVNDDEVRLTRLGGLLGAVNESASFVGPALGGVLVAVFGPSPVLLLDAASYLCAFVLIGVLVPAASGAADAGDDATITAGLRYLWRNHDVRRLVLGVGMISVSWAALVATVPVLALHRGGASVAGFLLGAYGAGSVVGGVVSSRARRARGRTAVMSLFGLAAASWTLVLALPTWAWALAIGGTGVASGLFFPRFFSSLTATVPPALRARVLSAVHIVISAPSTIGFVGAGLLAQQSTVASRLLIAGSGTLGAMMVAISPVALLSPNPNPNPTAEPETAAVSG